MAIAIALIVLVLVTVLFHIFSPWWLTPIASNWGMIDGTIDLTVWVTGFVFVAVNLFLAYAIIRYRHKQGAKAHYEPENKKLEIWLTAITTIGIMALLAPGLFVWAKFVAMPEDAMEFEVVGQQWEWSYRFPGEDGVFGAVAARFYSGANPFGLDPDDPAGQDDRLVASNEVTLPVNVPLKVLNRSKDVLHNFAVPQFRVKMDMVPGMVTSYWITPTRTGTFDVLCMELCGIGHYLMRGRVVVAPEADFNQWLGEQPTFAQTQEQTTASAAAGEQHYVTCAACHGAQGEGNPQMNSPKIAGLDQSYIERQLHHFRSGVRGASPEDTFGQQMAGMSNVLPDDDAIASVATYIASLPDVPAIAADTENEGNISRGKKLYQNCAVCHGDNGQGIWTMHAPRLAGMSSWYLSTQLEHFRSGIRGTHKTDQYGQQMVAMANILNDSKAIGDVIAYIDTLDQGQEDSSDTATGRGN
ncbi:MAG: cytochrome C oxidase [Gammaproteobacteria bacterium BRH_c0]|nr:MAG: cytochrome C oxidase [Gammaproteobacteria bacterium BRH_c0]